EVFKTLFFQRIAHFRGASALPDDRIVNRISCGAFPADDGFALVGNADRFNVRGIDMRALKDFGDDAAHRSPDIFGVMLYPSCARIVLRKGFIDRAVHAQIFIDQHGGGASGALVDGEDDVRHAFPLKRYVSMHGVAGASLWLLRSST